MAGVVKLHATEIAPGRHWSVGKYVLRFSGSGNLELWNNAARRLLWQSGTRGVSVAKMVMQEDGNLVIYDRNRRPLWSTGTNGNDAAYLTLQEDGNMVIYSQDNRALWQTDTNGR